jgi:hypothetical protein
MAAQQPPVAVAKRIINQPPLPRHIVIILIGRLDRSVTRALRYGRALRPAELYGLHVAVDPLAANRLARDWRRVGLTGLPLEIQRCPDLRLDRAVMETAIGELDGRTHVTLIIPRRIWRPWLAVVAHDRTAASLVRAVTYLGIDHLTVTVTPFVVGGRYIASAPPKEPDRPAAAA